MIALPRLRRPSPLVVDVAIAAIFVALTQWDVWVNEYVGGPPEVSGAMLLLAAVSLAWRRRRPLLSCAGVMGGIAAQALLTANAPESLAVSGPALISVYSVAAHGQRREALLGLALMAFALAIHDLNDRCSQASFSGPTKLCSGGLCSSSPGSPASSSTAAVAPACLRRSPYALNAIAISRRSGSGRRTRASSP